MNDLDRDLDLDFSSSNTVLLMITLFCTKMHQQIESYSLTTHQICYMAPKGSNFDVDDHDIVLGLELGNFSD